MRAFLSTVDFAEVGPARFTAPDFRPGTVRHVVLFRYRPETTAAQADEVLRRFRALRDAPRPDGRLTIRSLEAGRQENGEGAGGGFDHGFVVTFGSEGDRNHYIGAPVLTDPAHIDPVHAEFKAFAGPFIAEALVWDVVEGQAVSG